ncbi:MAG: SDR family NAD(P)-dependent oxidoreductase [Bacteroidaceae bacterium]|nr:SDR family NAD(P)-dependent oxidoreductase [Bacteroidaceae bacterium]
MLKFKDKTVLITGGGSGIGEAMAYQYAMKGANVILTGRRIQTLERVKSKCEELGVKAWCKTVDVEHSESIDELVEWIHSEGHLIDFLLLNAGISQRALTLETDISVDRRLMEVNYFGGIYLVKALKDMFIERGVHIAVVSSVSGVFGFPVRSAYCASKHAIHGFYETIALEYPQIKTTIIIPGRIHTEVSKNALDGNGKATGVMDPGQANGYDVNKCAKVAIRAIARGKHQKVIGGFDTIMVPFYKYVPWLFRLIARNVSAR